jgi:hypothetical protein
MSRAVRAASPPISPPIGARCLDEALGDVPACGEGVADGEDGRDSEPDVDLGPDVELELDVELEGDDVPSSKLQLSVQQRPSLNGWDENAYVYLA